MMSSFLFLFRWRLTRVRSIDKWPVCFTSTAVEPGE